MNVFLFFLSFFLLLPPRFEFHVVMRCTSTAVVSMSLSSFIRIGRNTTAANTRRDNYTEGREKGGGGKTPLTSGAAVGGALLLIPCPTQIDTATAATSLSSFFLLLLLLTGGSLVPSDIVSHIFSSSFMLKYQRLGERDERKKKGRVNPPSAAAFSNVNSASFFISFFLLFSSLFRLFADATSRRRRRSH